MARATKWADDRPEPVPASEKRLLEALRGGHRGAADELVERSYSKVFASLFKLTGDPELAADLTQETYAKAWRSLSRFDGRAQLSTWLFRIAYNTFLNHVRRPAPVRPLDEGEADGIAAPGRSLDSQAVDSEQARRLRRVVLGLPEELRFAVTARFWAELPVREIARLQGVSTVAVRKRLTRAFLALRLGLEGDSS